MFSSYLSGSLHYGSAGLKPNRSVDKEQNLGT